MGQKLKYDRHQFRVNVVFINHIVQHSVQHFFLTPGYIHDYQNDNGCISGLQASGRRKKVAFSSYLDHQMIGVQIDQIIKFNKMVLNEGNGYDNVTGSSFLYINITITCLRFLTAVKIVIFR